jgi:hypothetical protein
MTFSFEDISQAGVDHFVGVYKAEGKTTIVKVIKMPTFFHFVNDDENICWMEEVSNMN